MIDDRELEKLLLDNGTLDPAALTQLVKTAGARNLPLREVLLSADLLSEQNLGQLIAEYYHIPFITLTETSIDETVVDWIPEIIARKQHAFLFGKRDDKLLLATDDPDRTEFFSFLEKKFGTKVLLHFANWHDLEMVYGYYKSNLRPKIEQLLSSIATQVPIAEVLSLIIEDAYTNHASDIHIEPEKDATHIRFRIDGILHDILTVPPLLHQQLITRVKVACGLKTDEHVSAQNGKTQAKYADQDIDIRVSIVPVTTGEKAVMRLLSSGSHQFSLSDLGMREKELLRVRAAFNKPFGMLLATGPTGSGKTTTVYSVIKILNTRDVNIATIEDPVEYEIVGVNQIQVNPNTNLTFADGLKAILRQDPNVIFVGEIRDQETAAIAVNAATTGHLVLSTLHTNNAATTLPRLLDMQMEPFLIATTVNGIIGQRLVRRICNSCRTTIEIDKNSIKDKLPPELFTEFFGSDKKVRTYQGKGCNVCQHTGYLGRVGIFEVLEITPAIRDLIIKKATADEIQTQAVKEGMDTMLYDGLLKVQAGITTLDEVLGATAV